MSDSPIEKIHIQEFLSLVEGLEVIDFGRQSPPEPDFWAETNLGLIGIEHTMLTKKNANFDSVAEYRAALDILDKAKENFKMLIKKKVHVKVSFQNEFWKTSINKTNNNLQKVIRKDFAKDLADFVLKNLPEEGKRVEFDNFKGKFFHKEVKSIAINHNQIFNEVHFGLLDAYWLKDIINDSNFHDQILKKNCKPQYYEKLYSQIWLVLASDKFHAFSDSKLPQIQSTFDRVFIYSHADQKYHELQKGSR